MSSYTASTTCSLLIYLILARTGPGFKACNAPTQTNQTDGSRTHSRSIRSNWSETLLGHLSPAEKLNKRTIVRINIKSMNCFKNVSLVKHLPLLLFPRVSNSTYTSSPSTEGLLRHQQFPWLVLSSNSHVIQRVFVLFTWMQKANFLKLNISFSQRPCLWAKQEEKHPAATKSHWSCKHHQSKYSHQEYNSFKHQAAVKIGTWKQGEGVANSLTDRLYTTDQAWTATNMDIQSIAQNQK